MESHDSEYAQPDWKAVHDKLAKDAEELRRAQAQYTGGSYGDVPMDVNSPYPKEVTEEHDATPIVSMADIKAQEARESRAPLNRMERLCADAGRSNYQLFKRAFKEIQGCIDQVFDEEFIPHGDPREIMQIIDDAKNLLTVMSVYFNAITIPVMQSASIAAEMLSHPVHEPAADERFEIWPVHTPVCHRVYGFTHRGTVMEYDRVDDEYLVKWDNSQAQASWVPRADLYKVEV